MTALMSPVRIDADIVPYLSYALAHNGIPVIRSLVLWNDSDLSITVTVSIAVHDAQGALSQPYLITGELPPGRHDVETSAFRLDPAKFLQVEEQRPGTMDIKVESTDQLLAHVLVPIQVLAAAQWLSVPEPLAFELLAAFVLPNDPAVSRLIAEASALLEQRTGSSKVEGYQSGPVRADQIVHAIYDAMAGRNIGYVNPPASWADRGQKVRTPTEVLEGRAGTCLDTVVVLAAAFEQAGIRPLLWLVEGHAFLGYWRESMALEAIADTDVGSVLNQVDLGNIVLIETTMITGGDKAAPFESTHRASRAEHLSGDLSNAEAVVDVWSARHNGIVPLPSRMRSDDGTVQVVEYHAAESTGIRQTWTSKPTGGLTSATPARVQQWKNTLLDLSLRNKLIKFSERQSIALAVPMGGLALFEDIVNAQTAVGLMPSDQLDQIHVARGARNATDLDTQQLLDFLQTKRCVFTDIPDVSYLTKLRSLAYKARTIQEETGANNLYLALGCLVWSIDGQELRSPLILLPVNVAARARTGRYFLELDEAGASTPNFCLLEKLKQVHDLEIPGLANPVEDESGIDLDAALKAVREAIQQAGLPYRVEESADLAILQFAKFRLWKDLDEHWAELIQNPLVRHLVEKQNEGFVDPSQAQTLPDLDGLDASCPIPADSSQLEAIAHAVAGSTFVLEGPPGTGKSQTITNLLTRAIADGKKVLFVAEKRAALDVVQRRLASVGVGPFCLDLHDKGSKPAVVREQIKVALEHRVGVDTQGYTSSVEDLRGSTGVLARYAQRLHEQNHLGESYYSARTRQLLAPDDLDELPVPLALLSCIDKPALDQVFKLLEQLPDTAELTQPRTGHPWGFLHDPPEDINVAAAQAACAHVSAAFSALPTSGTLGEALSAVTHPSDLVALAALTRNHVPLTVLDQAADPTWGSASAALTNEIGAFVAAAHPGLDVATPRALDLPLADLHARARAAVDGSFFGRKKKLRTLVEEVRPALRAGAEVAPKRVAELLLALLQLQSAVGALAGRVAGVPGLNVPQAWNPLTDEGRAVVSRQVEWISWASSVVSSRSADDRGDFSAAARSYVASPTGGDGASAAAVQAAAGQFGDLEALVGASAFRWDSWATAEGLIEHWQLTAPARAEHDAQGLPLRRWVSFVEAIRPLAELGLADARALLLNGSISSEEARRSFDLGFARACMQERASATGLDAFDAEKHLRQVQRFTSSTTTVRKALIDVIPSEILKARPFQAGAERGQVGALTRELSKQRRGLGVRKLLEAYGPLITDVMPCVLVSPDSVSRFFPVGSQVFDLVVFDEASQIRVADAVGAMGRATSVVVVGDSKQMPPTTFAESASDRGEDEAADELVVEDQESVLSECVTSGVKQFWLSWHYRSVDESLIAFSNEKYYDGKLSSFPGPAIPGQRRSDAGISLVRVQGEFQRSGKGKLLRTNDAEARAVVGEIKRRFAALPDATPSIGVVTFNQQQRAHIEALIRDEGDERLVSALENREGEGLFVKNLENVQGDERDLILFSTGFSANDKGVVPLNFGPLNRAGGERRLNVAVTRARRQVIVFSSFDPPMLRAEDTTSVGIKHLRAYLDLASSGSLIPSSGISAKETVDRHREEVAETLREAGLVVHTNVGLSDFKVDLVVAELSAPERPLLAVLLDGPGWASRRTVNDRDGLPPSVLVRLMEWPAVERVWMPAWIANRAETITRLLATVDAVKSGRPAAEELDTPVAVTPAPETQAVVATPVSPSRLEGEIPYRSAPTSLIGGVEVLDALPSTRSTHLVQGALETAVEQEGPIHLDVLAKSVAARFGLSRVSAGRISDVLRALPRDLVPDARERFAWPRTVSPQSWTSFRPTDTARAVESISLRELGNAMVALCASCGGMEVEELLREALAVFGGRRMTTSIRDRLVLGLEQGVADGRLIHESSLVKAV